MEDKYKVVVVVVHNGMVLVLLGVLVLVLVVWLVLLTLVGCLKTQTHNQKT